MVTIFRKKHSLVYIDNAAKYDDFELKCNECKGSEPA